MKKIIFSFVFLLSGILFSSSLPNSKLLNVYDVFFQDDYIEINKQDTPVAITSSLKRIYPKAVLLRVSVNGYKVYKLEFALGSDLNNQLLCTEEGNFVQ